MRASQHAFDSACHLLIDAAIVAALNGVLGDYLAATGNPLFQTVLSPIQELLIESRRRTLGRHGVALAFEHHGQILAAVEAREPGEASRVMRDHIEASFRHLLVAEPDASTLT